MLSDRDLAKLTNTLQVPLVVQDIIDGQSTLTPDVQYGLHEIISNYYVTEHTNKLQITYIYPLAMLCMRSSGWLVKKLK